MFPFKVQLFQGRKSETEPINTKSVVQHVIRYQVLLATYFKPYTIYCCCRAKRRLSPIRVAFSIPKSQGQTFDKICLYLPKPVFSHGQLYVAPSRVRSLGSLSVVSETNGIVNCVYNEICESMNKIRWYLINKLKDLPERLMLSRVQLVIIINITYKFLIN
jgi:hypothetical protein